MCLGDWRLGRLIRSNSTTEIIAASGRLVIPANRQRVGIALGASFLALSAGALTVDVDGAIFTVLSAFGSPPIITVLNFGDIPTKELGVTNENAAGSVAIGITEWTLPEDVLALALESIRSQYRR